jgi:ABC-2 type transport system permease protein
MNMINLEHSPVNVTYNIKDTTKAILFQNVLKSYEKYISAVEVNAVGLYDIMEKDGMDQKLIDDTNVTISMDMIFTALGKEEFFNLEPVEKFPSTKVSEYYLMAILTMAVLYAGLYAGFGILKEIRQGTFIRLKTTRTSVLSYLTAKIFLLTAVFTVVSAVSLRLIFDRKISAGVIALSLAISLFSTLAAAFLSAFFKTVQRFILIGNLLIFYFIIVGGGIIPIQFLPEDIIRLAKITPVYYMIKGMILQLQGQVSPSNRIIAGFFIASVLLFLACAAILSVRSVAYEEA